MAKSVEVAASAARPIPADQLERVRAFTREPILLEGESPADLAPGSARYRAVAAAIDELDAGRETPSPEWRRRYSLLLGLERLLSTEPVLLADGTELTEHQVDVLSGTLAALTAELEGQRIRVARGTVVADALVVSGLGDPAALAAVVEGRATPQDHRR